MSCQGIKSPSQGRFREPVVPVVASTVQADRVAAPLGGLGRALLPGRNAGARWRAAHKGCGAGRGDRRTRDRRREIGGLALEYVDEMEDLTMSPAHGRHRIVTGENGRHLGIDEVLACGLVRQNLINQKRLDPD